MLNLLLATWVIVVPIDRGPNTWPNDQVWLHECGHALGAFDGDDALIPGTPLWANPKFDCRLHGAPRNMEVLRPLYKDAMKICKRMGGNSYACAWSEDEVVYRKMKKAKGVN